MAQVYLVGVRGVSVDGLTAQLGLGAAHAVEDIANTLPARYQVSGLTAVLVRTDGSAIEVIPDQGGFNIEQKVRALIPPAMVPATASPATASPATASPASTPSVTPGAAASGLG